MADKPSIDNVEHLVASLSPQQQSQLAARILQQLSGPDQLSNSTLVSIRELQLVEAEWISRELDEFVKLIQRYRALYISAIFVAVGWTLGQAVGTTGGISGTSLESLRHRTDIAAVLCIVPLFNVLFVVLVAETYAHIKSLARYRFILGCALGGGTPAWRWECWRESPEGTTHHWTNPLFGFSSLILLTFTVGALVFPFPAIRSNNSWWLWFLWGLGLTLSLASIIVVGLVGKRNWRSTQVTGPPTLKWSDLGQIEHRNPSYPPGKEGTTSLPDDRQASHHQGRPPGDVRLAKPSK